MFIYDIVVVGKNVSALVAAMYSGMAQKSLLHINCPEEKMNVTGVNKMIGYMEGDYNIFYERTKKQVEGFNIKTLEENVDKIVVEKDKIIIETDKGKKYAKCIIISTKKHLDMIEGDIKSNSIFRCGEALNGDIELISLCGTGCMASIDAQGYLNGIS